MAITITVTYFKSCSKTMGSLNQKQTRPGSTNWSKWPDKLIPFCVSTITVTEILLVDGLLSGPSHPFFVLRMNVFIFSDSFTRSIDPTNPFQIQQTLDTSPLFKDETDLTYKYNQFVCTYELRNGQQSPLGGYQVDAQVWKCLCFQAYCNSPTLAYVQAQMGKQFMDLALVSQDVGSANQQQSDDKKAVGISPYEENKTQHNRLVFGLV